MPKILSGLEDFLPPQPKPRSTTKKPTTPPPDHTPGPLIPNALPSITQPYRIAIIGEAPGRDEEIQGKPFVGMSGQVLSSLLSTAGIVRSACFVGNICQRRPYNNDITMARQEDVQEGLVQLEKDLVAFNPNLCILLGSTALHAARGHCSITDWRGSFFIGTRTGPFLGRKCLASIHPAACFRNYEWLPLLAFDIKKALPEGYSPALVLPQRTLTTNLTANEIVTKLKDLLTIPRPISIDIEGGINSMSCISIAVSPVYSFIIPFSLPNGDNYWVSFEDELGIMDSLCQVLANPLIPKILQNALYDRFVLQYSYYLCIASNTEDTMLKSWELYCELEKGLGFLCSLYTKEPFYKGDRKSDSQIKFWEYCCRDSAVTYEISSALTPMLPPPSKAHYDFNVALLNPMLYMELKGIKYDSKKASEKLLYLNNVLYRLQAELDTIAGVGVANLTNKTRGEVLSVVQEICCKVSNRNEAKKAHVEDYEKIKSILCKEEPLTQNDLGFISTACNLSLNIKSAQFKTYLYETLNLPKQYNTDPKTKAKSLTTDGKAMLRIKKATKENPHPAVDIVIQIADLRTRAQMLHTASAACKSDGRIHAGYNVVGSETGRVTCYKEPKIL